MNKDNQAGEVSVMTFITYTPDYRSIPFRRLCPARQALA